jgi:hypothetical protein
VDSPDTLDARRVRAAKNQSLFRSANERLESLNESFELVLERMDFACECTDLGCTEAVPLSIKEYEAIRAHPNRFVVVRGHELADIEDTIDENRGYVLVEKLGAGAEVARNADPRRNGAGA